MVDINIEKYQVNKPYPKISIKCSNQYWARLIQDDYSSKGSEYTAISQYIYAHITATEDEIAETFLGIGIVEMYHLDLLGDLLVDLGDNPVFISGDDRVWSSDFVPYGYSTKNRIELAIDGERAAIKQYEEHIKLINDLEIKKLLCRIIEDEKLHIKIFKQLLEKFY